MSDQLALFAPSSPAPATDPTGNHGRGSTRKLPHYLTALHDPAPPAASPTKRSAQGALFCD